MTRGPTRVLAGVDEAGLGPLLGPLTLGWSAFRVPGGDADPWRLLERIVTDDPGQDRHRLVVADSKRVHARNPRGARRLEATALCFLAQLDPAGLGPRSGREFLASAPPELATPAAVFAAHPWYERLALELPVHVPADRLLLRRRQLATALARRGVEPCEAGVRVLPAGELNRSFQETGNKGLSHWGAVRGIVEHLWRRLGEEDLTLDVDRLGARRLYADPLRELLPGTRVEVVREAEGHSEYHVHGGSRRMRIAFSERAEERSFAVALASCLAKYARELCMQAFNEYFGALQPGLRPTAGYTADGRRWLDDARPALSLAGLPSALVVRRR